MGIRKFLGLLLFLFCVSGCSSTSGFNLDKQIAFEAGFSPGMSEEEVIEVLNQSGVDFQLTGRRQLENEEIF